MRTKFYLLNIFTLALVGLLPLRAEAADVPFLSQAPLGQWRDWRQAQGCEEAASLMAVAWAKGWSTIDKKWGRDQIVAMSNWEKKNFGHYVDTSIQDTADRLVSRFIGYKGTSVHKNINVKDVAREVWAGNVVIVPIDGRKIGRPHYVNGGPRHHVLVVFGYNRETDTFTFHDPGKTFGANKTIKGPALRAALFDYPSGNGGARTYMPASMIVFQAPTSTP